jgi:hypothetical protein
VWKLKRDYRNAVKSTKKLEEQLEIRKTEKPGPEGIELEVDEDEDSGFFKE